MSTKKLKTLEECKIFVNEELKKSNLTTSQLKELLNYDNTNSELIYRYLKQSNLLLYEINNYHMCLSVEKCKEFNFNRKSFKEIFFMTLEKLSKPEISINEEFIDNLNKFINNIKILIRTNVIFNQPFIYSNNTELIFYYLTECLITFYEKKKNNNNNELLNFFNRYNKFNVFFTILKKYQYDEDNILMNQDMKKFFCIIYILFYCKESSIQEITNMNDLFENTLMKEEEKIAKIKGLFKTENISEEIFENNKINFLKIKVKNIEFEQLKNNYYEFFSNKINLIYDEILKENYFTNNKDIILKFLYSIYNSKSINQIYTLLYNQDEYKEELYFKNLNNLKYYWENYLILIPFKDYSFSAFCHKETLTVCHYIYLTIIPELGNEESIENQIFNLGIFIRTEEHECIGHFLTAYIYFQTFNKLKKNYKRNLNSPKISNVLNSFIENDILKKVEIKMLLEEYNLLKENYLKIKKGFVEEESGNLFEFLLFGNFENKMNLLECLFFLNTKNYSMSFLDFRKKYKQTENLNYEEAKDFIKNINPDEYIKPDLFEKFKRCYENLSYDQYEKIFSKYNFKKDDISPYEIISKKYGGFGCMNTFKRITLFYHHYNQNVNNNDDENKIV